MRQPHDALEKQIIAVVEQIGQADETGICPQCGQARIRREIKADEITWTCQVCTWWGGASLGAYQELLELTSR